MSQGPRQKTALGVVLAGLAAASLFGAGDYLDFFLFSLLINATMAVSYDLPGGYLGLISLGHAAYFGMGGYAFGIALSRGAPWPLALVAALAAGGVAGLLLAFPLARLKDGYYSLATLGILFILKLGAESLGGLTGGSAGLYAAMDLSGRSVKLLALGLFLATCLMHWLVLRSRFGLLFRQTEASEDVARSVGIDTDAVKLAGIVFSSLPAALAGALYIARTSYLSPDSGFSLSLSITALLASRLLPFEGLAAPVFGAVLLSIAEELIWTGLAGFQHGLFGALLLAFAVYKGRSLLKEA